MSLLSFSPFELEPMAAPAPIAELLAEHADADDGVGVANYEPIDQKGASTCWAAVTASALKAFNMPVSTVDPDGPEAAFAKQFWRDSTCAECAAAPAAQWDRPVSNLACVLDFAGIYRLRFGPPGYLTRERLLGTLGAGNLAFVVMSGNGGSHVVCLWHALEQPNGRLVVNVHDPLNSLVGPEFGAAPFVNFNRLAYAVGGA